MTKEQELDKMKNLLDSINVNMRMLNSAIEKNHVPNTYATAQAIQYAMKELDKYALKRYKEWQDGKDF